MRLWQKLSGRSREALKVLGLAGILTLLFCATPVYRPAELSFFDLRFKTWSAGANRALTPLMVYTYRDSTRYSGFADDDFAQLFEILEAVGVKKVVVYDTSIFQDYESVKKSFPSLVQVFDEQALQSAENRDMLFQDEESLKKVMDVDGNLRGLPWEHPAVQWNQEIFRLAGREQPKPRGPRLMLMAYSKQLDNDHGVSTRGDLSLENLYRLVMDVPPEKRTEVLQLFRGKIVAIEKGTVEASDFAQVSSANGNLTAGQVHLRLQTALAEGWTLKPLGPGLSALLFIILVGGFSYQLAGRKPATVAIVGFTGVGLLFAASYQLLPLGFDAPVLALLVGLTVGVTLLTLFGVLQGGQWLRKFGGTEDAQFAGEESDASMVFTNLPPFLLEMELHHDEALLQFRRDYNEILAKVAERYHGKVLDFQGDAQMLGFGLRLDDDTEHAAEATSAALEIVAGVAELGRKWNAPAEQLKVHVGVCTGTIALGHLGADQKQDIAAIGDTTNTAARLMGAAMKSQIPVLISKPTFELAEGIIKGTERPAVELKGKSALVEVYAAESVDSDWQEQNRAKDKNLVPSGGILIYRGKRQNELAISAALGFVGFLVAHSVWRDAVFDQAEFELVDRLHRHTLLVEGDPRIVLVGIDEESLADSQLGSFPWNRKVYGQLIENLQNSGYQGLFFDVLFKVPRADDPAGDEYFAKMLAADSRVVIAGNLHRNQATRLEDPVIFPAADYELLRRRFQIGLIHNAKDNDGTTRWGYLCVKETASHSGADAHLRRVYPAAASAMLLKEGDQLVLRDDEVLLGDRSVRVLPSDGASGSIPIRFGPPATLAGLPPEEGAYQTVSFRRFMDPSDPIFEELQGKYLFVGQTLSTGDARDVDRVSTVVGNIKGVEVHARLFDNLLNDNYLLYMSENWRHFFLWLVAGLTIFILTRYRETGAYVFRLFLLCLTVTAFYVLSLWTFGLVGELLILLATIAIVSAAVLVGRYILTFRALARVVPEEVATELMFHHTAKDRRLVATILLTDIRGYTTLSEGRTAVAMLDVLNEYHKRTVACYDRYGGQALTYQGDAQIVVFGVFGNRRNPAADAVAAALGLQAICDDLRQEWGIESRDDFDVGAGLCTGEVEVGLLGGAANLQYSVVGETVRKAHKVQSLSSDLEAPVLLDEETFLATKGQVEVDDLGLVQPKGLAHEIRLFRAKAVLP